MSYSKSLVTIVPDGQDKTDLLDLGTAVGVSGGMSVALSATGTAPATHWGSHAWVRPEFAAFMTGAAYPDPLPEGYTTGDIDTILGNCSAISVDKVVDEGLETERRLTKREHFDNIISGLSLQVIEETP